MAPSGDTEHVFYDNDDQEEIAHDNELPQTSIMIEHNPIPGDEDDIALLSDPGDSQDFTKERHRHNSIAERRKSSLDRRRRSKDHENYKENKKNDRRRVSRSTSPNGTRHNGEEEGTSWQKEGSSHQDDTDLPLGCTLYVRNLPTHFQNEHVCSYFNRHGEVTDCRIVINPVTKESRGFGFVTYSSVEIADHAMAQMDQTEIQGRILRVEKARRNKPHDPTPGEYKGPTGASIKYDNRGRLKPGYVPYWDLPPPRTMNRGRSMNRNRDYHHRYHRSRSHPRYQRRSYEREGSQHYRGYSPPPPSHSCYHNSAGYYYSPPRHHVKNENMSRYYDDYYDYSKKRHHLDMKLSPRHRSYAKSPSHVNKSDCYYQRSTNYQKSSPRHRSISRDKSQRETIRQSTQPQLVSNSPRRHSQYYHRISHRRRSSGR